MNYKSSSYPNIQLAKIEFDRFLQLLLNDINNIFYEKVKEIFKVSFNHFSIVIIPFPFYKFYSSSYLNGNEGEEKVLLTLLIKMKNTSNIILKYIIGEIPRVISDKDVFINGIKKIFIHKMTSEKRGAFFSAFVKNAVSYVCCKYILTENVYLLIYRDKERCYIVVNGVEIDFLSFISFLGVSISNIRNYSKYFSSYSYKMYIRNGKEEMDKLEQNKYIIFAILKEVFLSYSISADNKIERVTSKRINIFAIELIKVYDILIDIKNNKINVTDIDSLNFKTLITLREQILYYFRFFCEKYFTSIIKELQLLAYNLFIKKKNLFTVKSKYYFDIQEYLSVNPSLQCLDQINILSRVMQQHKISNYSSNAQYSLSLRNVKLTNLGFICPVDTTEGINCGLIMSLAKNVKYSLDKRLQIPYYSIPSSKTGKNPNYMYESRFKENDVLFYEPYYRKNKSFSSEQLILIKNSLKLKQINPKKISVIPTKKILSYSENLIPFIFYNDPSRVLMGSKMQTQSLPLYKKSRNIIISEENKNIISFDSNIVRANQEGIITYVSNNKIIVRDIYNRKHVYYLTKFMKGNYVIINQTPIVWVGERVFVGQVLINTQDSVKSEFVTGNNLNVIYGNFFGYNFEDSIVLNKKVIYNNLFTSLHFKVYEIRCRRKNMESTEILSSFLPCSSLYRKRNIDYYGLVKEGSKVEEGDILIHRLVIYNKCIEKITSIFLQVLMGKYTRYLSDVSLKVGRGDSGRIIKTEVYTQDDTSSYLLIRIFSIRHRLLSLGDKLCGFYGNKGVISYFLSNKDSLYTNQGITLDLITDAIGVPSRMNLGQLMENLFGKVYNYNNMRLSLSDVYGNCRRNIKSIIYNLFNHKSNILGYKYMYNTYGPGKSFVRSGLNGFRLKESSFLGISRYFKLVHMIQDKVHYRTVGPYTEVIQHPIKGRNKSGAQRFGEMEMWALQAYGSSYTLQEILVYKSDDIIARDSVLDYFNQGYDLKNSTISEAFNGLLRELNGLFLNLDTFLVVKQNSNTKVYSNKVSISNDMF